MTGPPDIVNATEEQAKKMDVVIHDIMEIFMAHRVDAGMALNSLCCAVLSIAPFLDHEFEEVVAAFVEDLRNNKAEFYDKQRADLLGHKCS